MAAGSSIAQRKSMYFERGMSIFADCPVGSVGGSFLPASSGHSCWIEARIMRTAPRFTPA
jgi:hypothetical protein